MRKPLLSILVALYNEEEFIGALLRRVLAAELPTGMEREVIVVDDGSTDGSAEVVEEAVRNSSGVISLIRHDRNRGKAAAIRTALEKARGEFTIIQDADLEYDPNEYPFLLRPLLDGEADAVFGSRFAASGERRVLYFWHSLANWILTTLCNVVADLNLTDMETCYKAFRTALVQSIPIRSNRFGIEPELTIKLARRDARIFEVPIRYHGRTYEEGKKVRLRDAIEALYVILKNALTRDIYKDSGPKTLESISIASNFNAWMAETIRPHLGKSVLEIGAGIGNMTRLFATGRKHYVASDIDTEHLSRLSSKFRHRPNFQVRRCDLGVPEDFVELAGQMDSVVCLNVLEHVKDDVTGLRSIYGTLKAGGKAIILVPHGQEIYGSLDTALGHQRRYSQQELRQKMEQAGFRVECILEFNRISRPAWYVSGRLLKQTSLSIGAMRFFDHLVWLWRLLDRIFPWGPTSIVAIGRKA
jgi:glycosyltransferase involved in cell wall biosynthesis